MKFWDFPGMTQTLEPFRYLEPQEGHQIRSLSYSVSGDNILVCTGSATPLLYDRDGFLVATSGLYFILLNLTYQEFITNSGDLIGLYIQANQIALRFSPMSC